jgi:hypothetical protein
MDLSTLKPQGHSAHVHMELRLGGHVLLIAQMAPGFIVLKQPFDHPPADGEVSLRIDDSESSWGVYLAEGISAGRRNTNDRCVASSSAWPAAIRFGRASSIPW